MVTESEDSPARRAGVATALIALVAAVALLLWAKWVPYAGKAVAVGSSGKWSGPAILAVGGVRPGDGPSWRAAWTFTYEYGLAVWKALVAALLISAALRTLVPRHWLLRVLDRPGRFASAAMGGLVSMPSMMCTCCTAPVAVGLRRSGVPTAAAVAYWLGNPLLNPAVLVFLAFVAPWTWTVTRVVVGVLLVVGGGAFVSWLTGRHQLPTAVPAGVVAGDMAADPAEDDPVRATPARFLRALAGLSLVLLPEYFVVVMLIGALRGWLFPIGPHLGLAAALVVLLAAVVGTLLVIPTAGEIPILQGLALAGLSAGALGALLVTLPAVSLPGIAMVGKALGWRATMATTVVVMLGGLVGAGVLLAL
jgi:uncharacterized membrane protein YraQ (UPF0718 family)